MKEITKPTREVRYFEHLEQFHRAMVDHLRIHFFHLNDGQMMIEITMSHPEHGGRAYWQPWELMQ